MDISRIYVKILEEPAPKALRFRYECEGRSAGSLPGANSTQEKKTFPKIQIIGYKGRAVVVVSCVTSDPPYRPHPHNLVGKEGCKKGVCTLEIAADDMCCEFSNLGIQCVKKKDIEDSLKVREEIRVDPFRTGFGHKTQPGSIDLNAVRLCFQVFLEGPERGQFKIPLKAAVSEPIFDKKAINDLNIMKLSDCSSPVLGGKEIILLCDKVSKDDIEIRFFEEKDGHIVWESYGDFQPSDVHKQYAISFRTPQYHNLQIDSPSRVFIQLRCPSKDSTSIARPFDYIPLTSDTDLLKRKRLKVDSSNRLNLYFQDNSLKRQRVSSFPPIKQEPVEQMGYNSPQHQHQQHQQQQQQQPVQPSYVGGFSGGGLYQQNQNQAQQAQQFYSNTQQQQQQQSGGMRSPTMSHQQQQQQQQHNLLNNNSHLQQQLHVQVSSHMQQHYNNPQMSPISPVHHQIPGPSGPTPIPVNVNVNINEKDQSQVDLGNISLPNLSDVNLSLLESMSENFSQNLNLDNSEMDIQVLLN